MNAIQFFIEHEEEGLEKPTDRIAIKNQDWDRLRAIDFYMLFKSFLTNENPDGLKGVTIYLSDYGAKRQQHEEQKGPKELRKLKNTGNEDEDEAAYQEVLAKYQKNRLKYCYAIVDCVSSEIGMYLLNFFTL